MSAAGTSGRFAMFDNDSVGNDTGAFTSADGVVRQFAPDLVDATKATMQVEFGSLIAVAKLLANTSDAPNVNLLLNKTIEITVGPGLGRSWTIQSIDTVVGEPDLRTLTLVAGTAGTDSADPTIDSEFRIAGGDSHGPIADPAWRQSGARRQSRGRRRSWLP